MMWAQPKTNNPPPLPVSQSPLQGMRSGPEIGSRNCCYDGGYDKFDTRPTLNQRKPWCLGVDFLTLGPGYPSVTQTQRIALKISFPFPLWRIPLTLTLMSACYSARIIGILLADEEPEAQGSEGNTHLMPSL